MKRTIKTSRAAGYLEKMFRTINTDSFGGQLEEPIITNRRFKEEAEKHMIQIDKHDKYGWTITTPTEELLDYIILQGWEQIEMSHEIFFGGFTGVGGGKATGKPTTGTGAKIKPKGSNSRKHICPACGRIARTTTDFPLICGICHEEMIVES